MTSPGFKVEVGGIIRMQLYDLDTCAALLKYLRGAGDWAQAVVSVKTGDKFVRTTKPKTRSANTVCFPPGSSELLDYENRVAKFVCPAIAEVWRVDLTRQTGIHAVRYEPGGYYAAHTDTGVNLLDRHFTVVCYLNDDFEGGETSFPQFRYSVSPQRGMAVVFPATYVHRAERLISGEKYIIVSWLNGREPIKWI
jgi:predicted 2-oxoglutarate/Fe(II)-dependent dioxygenase YbiX